MVTFKGHLEQQLLALYNKTNRDFKMKGSDYILNTKVIDTGVLELRFRYEKHDIKFLIRSIDEDYFKYEVEMNWNVLDGTRYFKIINTKVIEYLALCILMKQSLEEWKDSEFIIAKLVAKSYSGKIKVLRLEDGLGYQADIEYETVIVAIQLGLLRLINADLIKYDCKLGYRLHLSGDVLDINSLRLGNECIDFLHPKLGWEFVGDTDKYV